MSVWQNETEQRLFDQAKESLPGASYKNALMFYCSLKNRVSNQFIAELCKIDRYFLLTTVLRRSDALHPWLYARSREVERATDGHIDLWAREHYKSTIITFAGVIQEIMRDPEITIGIFSHSKGVARTFVSQIKQELEQNEMLHALFPNIFWADPKKQSPSWSIDRGLMVQRKSNPKENTVEGHGLVDGQPISRHFALMVYDDVVTEESVNTADMILKTTKMWELSRSLSSRTMDGTPRRTWYIGTRYNYADTYKVILDRKIVTPRIYPATETGTKDGNPVFLSEADWGEKVKENSDYTLACQYLQNPLAGDQMEFKPEWIRRYEVRPRILNIAILVDPANSKKKGSSNSAFTVIGMDANRNKYLLDGAIHRMSLTERWEMLKGLRNKWLRQPGIQSVLVGYERYGMQSDIDHYQEMMRLEQCVFPITELNWPREGNDSKLDRIRRLIPDHQNWRFFYPYEGEPTRTQMEARERGQGYLIAKPIKRVNQDGRIYNVVEYLINNEYLFFPATTYLDGLDSMSRVYDMALSPPQVVREQDTIPEFAGAE